MSVCFQDGGEDVRKEMAYVTVMTETMKETQRAKGSGRMGMTKMATRKRGTVSPPRRPDVALSAHWRRQKRLKENKKCAAC